MSIPAALRNTVSVENAPMGCGTPAANACSKSWTPERVELLKALYPTGLSATQIAKQLGGVTRNAVIGKAHRMGLQQPMRPAKPGTSPRLVTRRPREAATSRARLNNLAAVNALARAAASTVALPAERPFDGPVVALLDLKASHCRFPIGDPLVAGFGFCGDQAEGGPYCTHHRAVTSVAAPAGDLTRALRRYTS